MDFNLMDPLLSSWPHRAAFSYSHQLVKLTLQILLGAPHSFCHPAKVDGTKEADGLFYTILWRGPGLGKVEAGNWRVYLNRIQKRERLHEPSSLTALMATIKPINRFFTKLRNIVTLLAMPYRKSVWDAWEHFCKVLDKAAKGIIWKN